MSGGKGGSESQKTEIPKWVEDPSKANIARAERVAKTGYTPYYGPDVAAFNPTQEAAFGQNIQAAEAFGLMAPGVLSPTQGMPEAKTYANGVTGYSSGDLFEQALSEFRTRRPAQAAQYESQFINPYGDAPAQQNTGVFGDGDILVAVPNFKGSWRDSVGERMTAARKQREFDKQFGDNYRTVTIDGKKYAIGS